MKYIIALFYLSFSSWSFTLNNNINAGFEQSDVRVSISSNSTCGNIGLTQDQLLEYIPPAINDYWNRVPTSRLNLKYGGIYETSDENFLTGQLCNPDLQDDCEDNTVPVVTEIVIACNNNPSNFPIGGVLGVTLPNNIKNDRIAGSVILLNNTAQSNFPSLTQEDVIAVIAHEIGHAIGLGHSEDPSALMYFSLVPSRTSLGQDDFDGVTYLYPKTIDGCGMFSVEQVEPPDATPFWWQMLLGILFIGLLSRVRKIKLRQN